METRNRFVTELPEKVEQPVEAPVEAEVVAPTEVMEAELDDSWTQVGKSGRKPAANRRGKGSPRGGAVRFWLIKFADFVSKWLRRHESRLCFRCYFVLLLLASF